MQRLKVLRRISKIEKSFFENMFIDSGKIIGVLGKGLNLIKKMEEFKVDIARD